MAGRVVMRSDAAIRWIGLRVMDVYGARLGRAAAFVVEEDRPEKEWLLLQAGLFHRSHKLIPLEDAIVSGNEIWAPIHHNVVMSSPDVDPEPMGLTPAFFRSLEDHYADESEPE